MNIPKLTEPTQARIERIATAIALLCSAVAFLNTGHEDLAHVALGGALGTLMPARVPASTLALGLATAFFVPMVTT